MSIMQQAVHHIQNLSVEKVMRYEPSKDRHRVGKCTVLIMCLVRLANG